MLKPESGVNIKARVKKAINTRKRYTYDTDECVLTYAAEHDQAPLLTVMGTGVAGLVGKRPLDFDPFVYSPRTDAALAYKKWREQVRILGHDVYTRLFRQHPDLLRAVGFYARGRRDIASFRFQTPRLTWVCRSKRSMTPSPRRQICAKHPMSRLSRTWTARRPPSRGSWRTSRGGALRVLPSRQIRSRRRSRRTTRSPSWNHGFARSFIAREVDINRAHT